MQRNSPIAAAATVSTVDRMNIFHSMLCSLSKANFILQLSTQSERPRLKLSFPRVFLPPQFRAVRSVSDGDRDGRHGDRRDDRDDHRDGDDGGRILRRQNKCLVHLRNSSPVRRNSSGVPFYSRPGPSDSRSIFAGIPMPLVRPAPAQQMRPVHQPWASHLLACRKAILLRQVSPQP